MVLQNKTWNFFTLKVYTIGCFFFCFLKSLKPRNSKNSVICILLSSSFCVWGSKQHSTFVYLLTTVAPVVSTYKSFKKMYIKRLTLTKKKSNDNQGKLTDLTSMDVNPTPFLFKTFKTMLCIWSLTLFSFQNLNQHFGFLFFQKRFNEII